jgi:flagellar hook-basal body complex protein FliE
VLFEVAERLGCAPQHGAASTALQLTMAVRNKVLEAYQELSRMQV